MSAEPFNKLSPAEAERLALLLEELGEAQQCIGKILRHGYESHHHDGGPSNRQSLERELGDVYAAVEMLTGRADVSRSCIIEHMREKLARLRAGHYLHHQDEP